MSRRKRFVRIRSMLPYESFSKNGILRLPPEILVDIFTRCLPTDHIRLSTLPQLLPPFTLARVCSYWRSLVLSSPQLWNRIILGSHETDSAKENSVFDFWLARAGPETMPLDILLIPQSKNALQVILDQEANAKYERETILLIQKFGMQARRWRTIGLNVLDVDVLEPMFAVLSPPEPELEPVVTAPLLEALEISTTHLGSASGPRVLQHIALTCPRLRSVSLMCPPILPGQACPSETPVLQNMRELKVRFCTSVTHALAWMDICPNLEHLKVQLFCRENDEEDPEIDEFDGLEDELVEEDGGLDGEGWVLVHSARPRPAQGVRASSIVPNKDTRCLTNLKCLELHSFSSPAPVGTILDSLATPALKTLRVSTSFTRIGPSNARWLHIALLLQRSGAPLEELRIAGTPMNVDDVRVCLLLSPRLRRLSIGTFGEMDELLGELTVRTSKSEPSVPNLVPEAGAEQSGLPGASALLCPELEVLDVADSSFSADALAAMVSSRFRSCGQGPGSDGLDILERTRLKELCVDKNAVRTVEAHPVLAKCIRQGLILIELEPNTLLNLRID